MEGTFLINNKKNDLRTYDNIQKIATVQGHYYVTGCLLDQRCNRIDLSKQQALDADQYSNTANYFTGNLNGPRYKQCFSLSRKQNIFFLFFSRNCEGIVNFIS